MTHDLAIQAQYDDRITVGVGSWGSSPPKFRIYSPVNRIYIGSYCALGYDVTIFAGGTHPYKFITQHHLKLHYGLQSPEEWAEESPSKYDQTKIGSDVWIGEGAVILSGVSIGHGAIVGAHAVVDKDVPAYAIVAGNRADIVKYRFDEDTINRLCRLSWWEWHEDHVKWAAGMICSAELDVLECYATLNGPDLSSPRPQPTVKKARRRKK